MPAAYRMDRSADSYSVSATPDLLAQALPFQVYSGGLFDCGPAYYTERSGLGNYLLLFTLSGAGEVDWGEGRRPVTPGSAALLDCMAYQYYTTAGPHWRFYYVHFQGKMDAFAPILLRRGAIFPTDAAAFEARFVQLLAAMDEAAPNACFICSSLINQQLTDLALVSDKAQADERVQRHIPALNACLAYLRTHYAQPVSLGEMAARLHMSKYYFTRVFQAYTRATPYAYVSDLRVNAARRLLIMTDASVQEIARQVGMADCNVFIRAFKKRCGVTPGAYRRLWRGAQAGND